MDGPRWLIDSNILLRWVQPNDPDYSVVASAMETLAKQGAVLCYTSHNVAEFWSVGTRPVDRNGFGLAPAEADRRAPVLRIEVASTSRQPAGSSGMAPTDRCT
jgi:hypothetical protein